MRFGSPEYLYLLLLLPAFVAVRFYTFQKRRKALRLLGDKRLVYKMMPQLSLLRENVKYTVLMLVFALLVLLLARPQMGTKMSKEERKGIEVMIAMDISNSMMAEDVAPSRLDKTKLLIENLVDHFTKDRVGMVVFAGDAFVQLPITNDYVSAKMFMQSITPALIPSQGTNIAEALDLCMKSFTKQEKIGKAIILITDGEDHEGGAEQMAAEARKKGLNVFVLGVGTTKGAPVPNPDGGYMIDNEGNEVFSILNEEMCRSIAQAGDGVYIHVENNNKAQELLNSHLTQLQKGDMTSVIYSEFDEQFQPVAIIILLLIIIELLISEGSNGLFTKLSRLANKQNNRFAKKRVSGNLKTLLLMLAFFLTATAVSAQSDRAFIRSGNKLYRQQKFDKAEIEYKKVLERNEGNPEALYNMGCAKMMQEQDSLALNYFQKAAELQKDKKRKAQVYHNAGVILQNHKNYDQAIEAYKNSLRNDPNSIETKYNLELCKKLNKKQNKNNQNKDQNKDNKDNKDKNKDDEKDKNKDDKKDKNKDDKKDQNKDQNKDNNKDQNKDKQNEQQKQQEENAEQLLNAAKMQEQATQEKVKRAMARQKSSSRLKNW